MAKIGYLVLALASLILAACFFAESNDETKSQASAILQFQSGRGDLQLASLQVGQNVYPDVLLKLSQDGSWQLQSSGAMRPLAPGESAQAVLTAPADAVLDRNWRPDDATITIRRIHIDAKVFGNVPLRLTSHNWFWGNALQAGKDSQDLYELKALTLADYQANAALAATEEHYTLLHSDPGSGTQSFPMQLSAKHYRFCMDKQDDGADTIRLLDSAGNAVVSLKAGDACVDVELGAGSYTMQHLYGGSGAKRAIFVRPAAAPQQPVANLAAPGVIQDQSYPEYWAVYLPASATHPAGYLSFNQTYFVKQIYGEKYWTDNSVCLGAFDAAAQLSPYTRPGEGGEIPRWFSLFNSKNFFLIRRDANGTPIGFSYPLFCQTAANADIKIRSYLYALHDFTTLPVLIAPGSSQSFSSSTTVETDAFVIQRFSGNKFELAFRMDPLAPLSDRYLGFNAGSVMRAITESDLNQAAIDIRNDVRSLLSNGGLNFLFTSNNPDQLHGDIFKVDFRYFPNGLSPALKDSTGSWVLQQGEVALFTGAGCTGPAMIASHSGVLSSQRADLGTFNGSLQLGPNSVATFTHQYIKNGQKEVFNQSGCLNNRIDLTQGTLEIGVTTTINIQTNACEYCNLAGLDFQGRDLTGVKLQHANLADGHFSNANLTGADLRSATLQGANLSNANLETANLCQAFLNGHILPNGMSGPAAQLSGAHLKNANLSGANLDGANFSNASFYSGTQQSCQPADCGSYTLPACASAYKASMNNTNFNNAYLAGVDMGSATANVANFSHAILFGASFNSATMNTVSSTGGRADFTYAFLQGADFTNAKIDYANFTNAYIDISSNNCMQVQLHNELTAFPGFKSGTENSCVTGRQSTPTCVQYTYGPASAPMTNSSNLCADGMPGPCSTSARWTPPIPLAESSQINSTCLPSAGRAPLCDGFTRPLNTCW